MNKISTKLGLALIVLVVLTLSFSSNASAAKKKVLLEQQTGAWCGWCVDGTVVMDKLIEKYPDQIIGVKWHNGDAMVLPEQSQLASTFKVTGYPSALVDRHFFGTTRVVDRGMWYAAAESLLDEEPIVDVATTFVYNETNDSIYITVTVNVLKDDNRQLAINAYVVEDSCSGTGSQWDQKNFLTNRPGFEGNPYYDQPSVLPGYQHMKVLRKVLDGILGDKMFFPATVKAGDVYTKTYTVKKAAAWKAKDLYSVGLVQAYVGSGTSITDAAILNAAESYKPELRVKVAIEEPNLLADPGVKVAKEFDITNFTDQPVTVNLASTTESDNWTVEFANPTIDIPANGTVKGNLWATPKADINAEYINIKFTVTPVAPSGITAYASHDNVSVLTSNTKNLVIGINPNISFFTNILKEKPGFETTTVQVPYNPSIISNYPASMFDFITIASGYASRGIFSRDDQEGQALRDLIRTAITNGTKLFITSELELFNIFSASETNPDAIDLFENTLGLGVVGDPNQVITVANNQITGYITAMVRGLENDPITSGLTYLINANASQDPKRRLYYTENVMSKNTTTTTPILEYVDQSGMMTGYAGMKIELPTTRVVFLSYGFEGTGDGTKPTLGNNIVNWLFATTGVEDNTADNFNMKMSPNPVQNSANFEYTVSGTSQNVNINVVDATGKTIANLVNQTMNAGTYNINFDASKYVSGKYHILSNVDGVSSQLPLVIVK